MKKLKRTLTVLIMACMVAGSVNTLAWAYTAPTGIEINGSTASMKVGAVRDLDSHILPYYVDIPDSRIVWTSSNSSVLRVLDKYDDDTNVKAVKAGTATVTVSISGTKLKDSITIKVSAAGTSSKAKIKKYQYFKKKISSHSTSATKIRKSIKSLRVASTASGRRTQSRKMDARIEALDRKVDRLEDTIEIAYRSGKLTRAQFRKLDRKLNALEHKMDALEDELEWKLGDDDYDDYDDDDYDD